MVAAALLVGCDDDLGRDRYVWDSSLPRRSPSDASQEARDGARADVSDASADGAREANSADGDAADRSNPGDVMVDGRADTSIDSAESGNDGWGDAGALRAVLLAESPSCLACAQASCPGEIVGCSTIAGKPDGGSEAGLSRSQLCVETLQCLLASGCEEDDTSTCYCGPKIVSVPDLCSFGAAEGVCKAPLERSLESVDPKVILSSMLSTDLGGGWAMLLSRCMRDNACVTCFPALDAGADAHLPVPHRVR